MKVLSVVLVVAQFLLPLVAPANIVIFQHVISYSHRVTTWPLAEALAEKGHQVTYITPYAPKHPNPKITEIVPKKMSEFVDATLNAELDINLRIQHKMANLIDIIFMLGSEICKSLYASDEFKVWLDQAVKNTNSSKNKIDLFIIDNSAAIPECGVALAYKLKAKHIIIDTIPQMAHEYDIFGFSPETASVPELEMYLPQGETMTFMERVTNAITSIKYYYAFEEYYQSMDKIIRESLDLHDMPFIGDVVKWNTSLIFYTGDQITDYSRSLPPLYVNIAGIHAKSSNKPLPENIAKFLNSTPNDGFIYISLGSLVVSSNLPDSIKNVFFETIKAFPQLKFLWKWNGDFPETVPENLLLAKWFPQVEVLSHPKIRGFVTQCGRPSTSEALYNGVPMIAFPILGDQDFNSKRVNENGGNVRLEIGEVTVEQFKEAVQKVAYDKSMKERVLQLQKTYRDRPMTPLDTAVWWTEYVLRSENTHHLRPAGISLNWYQRRHIDVWAFLSISAFIVTSGAIYVLVLIVSKFANSSDSKLKRA